MEDDTFLLTSGGLFSLNIWMVLFSTENDLLRDKPVSLIQFEYWCVYDVVSHRWCAKRQ